MQRAEPVLVAHWLLAYAQHFLKSSHQRIEILARLDGANEEQELFLNAESIPCLNGLRSFKATEATAGGFRDGGDPLQRNLEMFVNFLAHAFSRRQDHRRGTGHQRQPATCAPHTPGFMSLGVQQHREIVDRQNSGTNLAERHLEVCPVKQVDRVTPNVARQTD